MTDLEGYVLPKVDSTNAYLKRLANEGKIRSGYSLMAYEQTAGRGRGSRVWKSEPGESMTASYWVDIEAENLAIEQVTVLPLVAGLAVAYAGEERLRSVRGKTEFDNRGSSIALKWPNDVWIRGEKWGKFAGILCEFVRNRRNCGVIVGIGLNLRDSQKYLTDLPRPACAWFEAFADSWRAEEAFEVVGRQLYDLVSRLAGQGVESLAQEWYTRCLHKDKEVSVNTGLSPSENDFLAGSIRIMDSEFGSSEHSGCSSSVRRGRTVGLGRQGELLLQMNCSQNELNYTGETVIEAITIGDVDFSL